MRRRVLFVGLLGILIALGWVSPIVQVSASSLNVGFVRFAHTAVDVGPVDIYQGETSQRPIVTDLAYGEFTDFLTLNVTTTGFVARLAGSGPTGKVVYSN